MIKHIISLSRIKRRTKNYYKPIKRTKARPNPTGFNLLWPIILQESENMKIINVLKNLQPNTEYIGEDSVADMYYKYKITNLNKPIIIQFPPHGVQETNDNKTTPYGLEFLCKYDINIICFGILGDPNLNYFINPNFSIFIEDLGKLLTQFKLRLGYSNSKGGFGIGTYAKALNLDSVLLFFPISAIKKELVPWDTRKIIQNVKDLYLDSPYDDVNLGECKGYVLYNPLDEIDVKHANRFKGLKHIKIYGFIHGTGFNFLARHSDLLKDIAQDFFISRI